MAKQKGMSFVEKAGLLFGFVGLLADFAALVSFYYGFASLSQFTPSHVSYDSAISFFRWFSGLMIIYSWFITSWYLVRRTFVLRYERPKAYKNPLNSRTTRTIFGVGLFLVPTFIYWSIVNVTPPNPTNQSSQPITQQVIESVTPTPEASATLQITETLSITDRPSVSDTPNPTIVSTSGTNASPETLNTSVSLTEISITPSPSLTLEERQQAQSISLGIIYYMIIFPFGLIFFGLVIYACINSLMPIVHVELLDDYE